MPYYKKIVGERIYLSPLDPGNVELHTKWVNDIEVARWIQQHSNVFSPAAERDWLENAAKDIHNHCFVIVRKEDDRPLGSIGLDNLHPYNRTATLGILIGEAEDRSKGYGAEAIRLLVDYGFRWLGLHNIELSVNSENARAIACYKKAGFREYGRRRQSIFFDGHWADTIRMEILAEERGI